MYCTRAEQLWKWSSSLAICTDFLYLERLWGILCCKDRNANYQPSEIIVCKQKTWAQVAKFGCKYISSNYLVRNQDITFHSFSRTSNICVLYPDAVQQWTTQGRTCSSCTVSLHSSKENSVPAIITCLLIQWYRISFSFWPFTRKA